VPCAP